MTINGVNFTGTTAVHFNGTSANFHFVNDAQLTATVPAGATTGPISVTNGYGTGDTTASRRRISAWRGLRTLLLKQGA